MFSSHREESKLAFAKPMACGAPVAAMWCGGPEDIVQGGVTNFLVPRDDPMEMLTTVEQLLRDGGLRERMSQTEYKHI